MNDRQEWSIPAADLLPGMSAKFPLSWRGAKTEGFVINFDGRYHAYVNRCAHAGTPLDWWPNEFFTENGQYLICATHGAVFGPDTGICVDGPCPGERLDPLRVERDGESLVVTWPA